MSEKKHSDPTDSPTAGPQVQEAHGPETRTGEAILKWVFSSDVNHKRNS